MQTLSCSDFHRGTVKFLEGVSLSLSSNFSTDISISKKQMKPSEDKQYEGEIVPTVNLTWVILFTGFICGTSLVVDDIFFKNSQRHFFSSINNDWLGENDFSESIEEDYDDNQNDHEHTISFVITARTVERNHAAVHGGAVILMFGILAIWCLSAYISIVQLDNSEVQIPLLLKTKKTLQSENA